MMQLPDASLFSFPVEFLQGMKARADILGDTRPNAPENWDDVWREERVHIWLAVSALSPAALKEPAHHSATPQHPWRRRHRRQQDAAALQIDGKFCTKEHFGYTDGFGNPDYLGTGASLPARPRQNSTRTAVGRPSPPANYCWVMLTKPVNCPSLPLPHLLANNGTFMVYRKLHQNVATFRNYLEEKGKAYPAAKRS